MHSDRQTKRKTLSLFPPSNYTLQPLTAVLEAVHLRWAVPPPTPTSLRLLTEPRQPPLPTVPKQYLHPLLPYHITVNLLLILLPQAQQKSWEGWHIIHCSRGSRCPYRKIQFIPLTTARNTVIQCNNKDPIRLTLCHFTLTFNKLHQLIE